MDEMYRALGAGKGWFTFRRDYGLRMIDAPLNSQYAAGNNPHRAAARLHLAS